MSAATIRPATLADVDTVLALWRADDVVGTVTDTREHVTALIRRDDDQLLLAEVEGRIAGTLIAAFDGWRGSMYRLVVAPEARRQGVARALVTEGERRLEAKGVVRIHAGVRGEHDHATGFWAAAGYRHHPEMRRYTKQLNS